MNAVYVEISYPEAGGTDCRIRMTATSQMLGAHWNSRIPYQNIYGLLIDTHEPIIIEELGAWPE